MEKRIFTIISNTSVACDTYRLVLEADEPGFVFSGEFVDIALEGFYLRRPISVCDAFCGGIILYYKVVGQGTEYLSGMKPGAKLDVLTGLGKGFTPEACSSSALLVAGGLGAAPLFILARKLKAAGRKVTAILGFNKSDEIILEDEYRSLCDDVVIATVDGSAGVKGFVTDAIEACRPEFDYYYTCGPMVMMKAVCSSLGDNGELSLEERMGCGSGFCYGCSCKTLVGTKRICADGPVFKKEDLIW